MSTKDAPFSQFQQEAIDRIVKSREGQKNLSETKKFLEESKKITGFGEKLKEAIAGVNL